jgi:hypothetical protein
MGQKRFFQYWRMVVHRAFLEAWDKVGASGTVFGILVAIVVAYLVEKPKSLSDFGLSGAVMPVVISALFFTIVMVIYICREPFNIHNEQQLLIGQREQEVEILKETAKPKLELRYDENWPTSIKSFTDREGKTGILFRIRLKNISTIGSAENIKTELLNTNRSPQITDVPAELSFMHNEDGKRLNAGTCLWIDAVNLYSVKTPTSENQYFERFGFERKDFQQQTTAAINPTQPMQFTIQASGSNTTAVCRTFELFFRDENGEKVPQIREVT